jgi:biotin carboxylase
MKNKLAIIGASYLQLPLVLKAKDMGLSTVCFSWEEGAVCKGICDKFYPISILEKEKILEVCDAENISGIISISSDIAVPSVNFIADKLGLISNPPETSLVSTNKFIQRTELKKKGIKMPDFENYKNLSADHVKTRFRFPIVIKPVDRSGSKGVVVVKKPDNILPYIEYSLKESLCGEVIVEEFIEGEEISVESISWQGNHTILTFTDKVTTGFPHFVELEHHQPSKYWESDIHDKIFATVISSLNTLGLIYGASHSELIITPDGEVYVTEIGARMGGDFIGSDLVYLSTGYDFLKGVIGIALGHFENPVMPESMASGVYFYSEKTMHIGEIIKGMKFSDVCVKSEITNDKIIPLTQSADRSGYFIYQSKKRMIL